MITLDQIGALLTRPKRHHEESWELRFLFDQEPVPSGIIYAEYSEDTAVLRCTLQATSSKFGRARLWLKRSLTTLSVGDISTFFNLITKLAELDNLKIVLSPACEALVAKYGGLDIYTTPSRTKTRRAREAE